MKGEPSAASQQQSAVNVHKCIEIAIHSSCVMLVKQLLYKDHVR